MRLRCHVAAVVDILGAAFERAENRIFLKFWMPITSWVRGYARSVTNMETHIQMQPHRRHSREWALLYFPRLSLKRRNLVPFSTCLLFLSEVFKPLWIDIDLVYASCHWTLRGCASTAQSPFSSFSVVLHIFHGLRADTWSRRCRRCRHRRFEPIVFEILVIVWWLVQINTTVNAMHVPLVIHTYSYVCAMCAHTAMHVPRIMLSVYFSMATNLPFQRAHVNSPSFIFVYSISDSKWIANRTLFLMQWAKWIAMHRCTYGIEWSSSIGQMNWRLVGKLVSLAIRCLFRIVDSWDCYTFRHLEYTQFFIFSFSPHLRPCIVTKNET